MFTPDEQGDAAAYAQDKTNSLEKRVATLEALVKLLTNRIEKLENPKIGRTHKKHITHKKRFLGYDYGR